MASFISRVVDDLIKSNHNITNTTFVLPSQRACVYLKDTLKNSIRSTTFLPEITSIENYIQQVADMMLIDNVQLLFEFYSIYKQSSKKESLQSFEVFAQWATIVLHDFSELDSYLVNPQDFFSDLKDIKRLNNWFQDKNPTKLAINYLDFFEQLHDLYNRLYTKLKSEKVGYQGLIYREANENLEYYIQNNSGKKIVFIGFNALNKSEEILFQELLDHDMATIYWDCNATLMESKHEAGLFLRNYRSNWSYYKRHPFNWVDEAVDYSEKSIHIVGAPKNTTQLKYAGELLSQFLKFENTACVLADEKVLPLMLNSLPESVDKINITMGYPLKDLPIALLFDKLFILHLNQEKFGKKSDGKFYYKDVIALLNDPGLLRYEGSWMTALKYEILKGNMLFITAEDMRSYAGKKNMPKLELFLSFFLPYQNIDEIISRCLGTIDILKETADSLNKEYLFGLHNIFQQLITLNKKYRHIKNLKVLRALYKHLLQNEKLSFQGEPLMGLQLMGMLETRALDFDKLIITSVNEGILPSGKKDQSFIPYDAKRHYGLPTYHDRDAIFSYHFYRLLQRVKECYLLYNSETDGYGSGEKSRFLTMLRINYPEINEKIVSPGIHAFTNSKVHINKTPALLKRIENVLSEGVSPSALTTYIGNPIRFYEQKILGIKSKNEIEETVERNTMGSVIHDVLEVLYKPFVGLFIKQKEIQKMRLRVNEVLNNSFQKYYKGGAIDKGKNKLIFEVCKKYIINFLNAEEKNLKNDETLKIIALEKKLEFEIRPEGFDFPVKIHGIVDRIEERNGILRIIDYKTGGVEQRFLTVLEPENYTLNYNYSKAFQIMMYASLFISSEKPSPLRPLTGGIISFKSLNSGFMQLKFSRSKNQNNFISSEHVSTFMDVTENLLKEICNPDIDFIEKSDAPF